MPRLNAALLVDIKKEGRKIFGEFVFMPHLFFPVAVAAIGRERWLDNISSRRKTKTPLIFKTLLRMAVLKELHV